MVDLFKDVQLHKRDGTVKIGEEALRDRIIGVYYSAHWCPPCRQFTPVLKDFYDELDQKDFEVVFVSFDHKESDLHAYMDEAHGNWYYVRFGDPAIDIAKHKIGVSGIPTLVIFGPNGDIITKTGRTDVTNKAPAAALSEWMQAAQ